jgi:2-desacetyl-2-hydroxyethyl bacteriochlorophyllide A dehydrogenase
VCGTDLHAFEGKQPIFTFPRILGHELAIEVVEAPANNAGRIRSGDRCAVEPYLNCGQCHACHHGKSNCCEQLKVLGVTADGGMREMLTLPVRHLYKSERLSLDQLALVETLSIGAHAVTRSQIAAGEDVLVVGAGPIGLATTQFARAAGGRVRVLETSAYRREFMRRLGVETLAAPDDRLADLVFDATGNPVAMEQSLARVAHGGRVVFVGLVQGDIRIDDVLFHLREITLFASRNSVNEFPRIISMIEQGRIDTTPWITHRMNLEEVPDRFAAIFREPGCIKTMIEIS